MNKKSIAALSLAVTMTLGVGASYAWFTSQATSTNNSVQTGTLSIGGSDGTSVIRTFTLSNLYPGTEGSKSDYITVRNNGSINLQYKVSAALSTGEEGIYNIAKVKVTKDSGQVVYDGNLNALNGYLANSNLPVGSSERLAYTVSLPDDADNSYQGKTSYVNFVIDATQYNDTSFIVNNGSSHSVVNVKADATNTDGVNFSTLQSAIDAVPNGGTINVAAGTYSADQFLVLAEKSGITIQGAGIDKTIFNLTNAYDGFKIQENNVTLKNFAITTDPNAGVRRAYYGLRAQGVDNLTVDNVKITNMSKTAFDINGVTNSNFYNLLAVNNGGYGIAINQSKNVTFTGTTDGNKWGAVNVSNKVQPYINQETSGVNINNISSTEALRLSIENYIPGVDITNGVTFHNDSWTGPTTTNETGCIQTIYTK